MPGPGDGCNANVLTDPAITGALYGPGHLCYLCCVPGPEPFTAIENRSARMIKPYTAVGLIPTVRGIRKRMTALAEDGAELTWEAVVDPKKPG